MAAEAPYAGQCGVMTCILYNRPGSGGFVVEAALTLAGAPFELIELDSKAGTPLPESFRETNPWGQLPTLILPDGDDDDGDIGDPGPPRALLPGQAPRATAPARGRTRRSFAGRPSRTSTSTRRCCGGATRSASRTIPRGHEALRSAANRRMGEGLALIDAHVEGPFLLGAEMTVADIYIAMLFVWHRGGIEAPRLARIAEAVRGHPVVGPIWRRHVGDRQPAFNAAKTVRSASAAETS